MTQFDEAARQRAVERYEILDTPQEVAFDRVTSLVRRLLDVPMSALSFVDADRSWIKACDGMAPGEFPRSLTFCEHVIRQPEPLIVPDTSLDPRFRESPYVIGSPFVASYVGFPVRTPDGFNVGSLCAMDTKPRLFSREQVEALGELTELAAEHIAMRRIATQDHLTGALSRRAFLEALYLEVERHFRYDRPAALLVLDVDHFKRVNDTYGHATGDDVLQAVAKCCKAKLRPTDQFGRLGGEEFAILLPETDAESGLAAAERFRKAIAGLRVGDHRLRVTASFGVAALTENPTARAPLWLAAADAALYEAKHAGRNASRLHVATAQAA